MGGTPDFLALSKDAEETSRGFLQGVAQTDSAGPYVYTEYYSDSLSFQLIYVPNQTAKASVTFEQIQNAAASNYAGFEIFAFVYPMKDPYIMEDYHDDNVTYPVKIKGYVRRGTNWQLLSKGKAKNLTELSSFMIKNIYSVK